MENDVSAEKETSGAVELIARLERSTGPDRELDVAIGRAYVVLHGYPINRGLYAPWEDKGYARPSKWCWQGYHDLPEFTASIDAAMSLVPEGFFLAELGECAGINGWWQARIAPRRPNSTTPAMYQHYYGGFTDGGKPKTGPAALCIAAINALTTIYQERANPSPPHASPRQGASAPPAHLTPTETNSNE